MIIKMIGISLLAYFLGNFSPSFLAGKLFRNIDIREHGSGNAGTTNVIRVIGWKIGAGVFIIDIVKGCLVVFLGDTLGGELGIILAGFFVVIGHNFPILLNFRGGKGVAATAGIFLYLFPIPTLIAALLFALIVLLTRMVSVGSLSFVLLMIGFTIFTQQSGPIIMLTTGLAIFVFIRHKTNIQRILQGKENKLSFGQKTKINSPTS